MRFFPRSFAMTSERRAQLGISVQFLVMVRTLGEIFRLKYVDGVTFPIAAAMPYVGGVLIAACCCWTAVIFYFFRRYSASAWIALASVFVLLVHKIAVID